MQNNHDGVVSILVMVLNLLFYFSQLLSFLFQRSCIVQVCVISYRNVILCTSCMYKGWEVANVKNSLKLMSFFNLLGMYIFSSPSLWFVLP
jgi:hypothetical protein